ncbi:hypothetical protein ATANTOWER_011658 [Ataeniobius toweri]|uniref:Uncharacterized protein n=1 Tax=Ataeniobius toweri TaxID=208326 RepID=A0ABU7AGS5_9TELE|nr:hypothetical protein [Ataeniobius toweri]
MSTLEALEKKILQDNDLEVEVSSDSRVNFEVDKNEELLLHDPIHNQEVVGPSGTERTQPPTTSVEALTSSSSDAGAKDEEDEQYEPPGRQLRNASRPMKRKVASVPRKRSSTSTPTKRGKQLSRGESQATSTPGDDNEDQWNSPGEPDIEAQAPTFTQRHPPGPRLDTTKSWSPQTC